jgi:hypothetical protein
MFHRCRFFMLKVMPNLFRHPILRSDLHNVHFACGVLKQVQHDTPPVVVAHKNPVNP